MSINKDMTIEEILHVDVAIAAEFQKRPEV